MNRVSVSMLRRMQPLCGSYRLQTMSLRQFSRIGTIRRQNGVNLFCLGGGIVGLTLVGAGLFGWFDEWLKNFDQDKKRTINHQLMLGGLSMSGFFGGTLVVCHLRKTFPSSFHLLYTKRAVGKELRKYQPRVFKPSGPALLPIRSQRLRILKQCVCAAFQNRQAFDVVTGPHGVGKSLLAEHLAAELSSKGNDLCDLKNLGVVYWECVEKETDNTEGILDQFGDSLGEIGVASVGRMSYSNLFGMLQTHLPRNANILIIFDGVSKDMEGLGEFQKQVRRISQLKPGRARIKVLVVESDSYDFAKEEEQSRYENRRRVINILGFTLPEMTEWIDDFLKTRNVKLVNVPHETSAAESVDRQATMSQDGKLKKEAGADGEKKEMKDTEKLASLILKHEWNMNEVETLVDSLVKPDPDDEKKEKKILNYADVAENLKYVLHVTYKWLKIDDKKLCSTMLKILCEVNPKTDDDGRIFYDQTQLLSGGLSVKQIEQLCKADLAVEVRFGDDIGIFIHPQLYYFARNRPDRHG